MRDYGFVIPGNINDRVPFSAGKLLGRGGAVLLYRQWRL